MYLSSQPFHIEHIPRCRRADQSNIIASPILNGEHARRGHVRKPDCCLRPVAECASTHRLRGNCHRALRDCGSFPVAGRRASAAVSAIDRVPAPAVKTASLSLQASSRDRTATSQPRSESSCKSFEFSFFNPSCSGRRNHQAARRKHRVATFIPGDSERVSIVTSWSHTTRTIRSECRRNYCQEYRRCRRRSKTGD